MSNPVTLVGGFASTERSLEPAAEELGRHYDDVAIVSFSAAMERNGLRNVPTGNVVTHSAGMLAVKGRIVPERLIAFNAPTFVSPLHIVAQTAIKAYRLFRHCPDFSEQIGGVVRFHAEAAKELAKHPVANFGAISHIARFDAIHEGVALHREENTDVSLVWTGDDVYFKPDAQDAERAQALGIDISILEGEHDEFVIRPHVIVPQILEASS